MDQSNFNQPPPPYVEPIYTQEGLQPGAPPRPSDNYQPSAPPFQETIIQQPTIQPIPYPTAGPDLYPAAGPDTPIKQTTTITTPIPTTYSNIIIIPNSTIVHFDVESIKCKCQFCNITQYTKTKKKYTWCAHLSSLLCILCGCFYGCCLIPYCIDDINITKHYCRNCKKYLGSSQPDF